MPDSIASVGSADGIPKRQAEPEGEVVKELDPELLRRLTGEEPTITGRLVVASEVAIKRFRRHEEPAWDLSEAKRRLFLLINRSSYSPERPWWLGAPPSYGGSRSGRPLENRGFLLVDDRLAMPIGARLAPRPPKFPLPRALIITCLFRDD